MQLARYPGFVHLIASVAHFGYALLNPLGLACWSSAHLSIPFLNESALQLDPTAIVVSRPVARMTAGELEAGQRRPIGIDIRDSAAVPIHAQTFDREWARCEIAGHRLLAGERIARCAVTAFAAVPRHLRRIDRGNADALCPAAYRVPVHCRASNE